MPSEEQYEQQEHERPEEPPEHQMRQRPRLHAGGLPPEQLIGRRVELCGLIAKALLNGRRGTALQWHAERGRLLVALDGLPEATFRLKHVRELPEGDDADVDGDEPPVAPAAGAHYVGDRVLVERSNGSRSVATVVEYDEVLEYYVVDVGRGVLKYGVEESYLTPRETSDVWAGPMARVYGRW